MRTAELFGAAYWLAQQIGRRDLFSIGATTHGQRVELLRQAIRDQGLESNACPEFRGVMGATYAEAFLILFGVPLEPQVQPSDA